MIHRIQRRETFRRLRKPRCAASHGALRVAVVDAAPGERSPAVAFSVPTRVGSAVVRNRLRRQLRHLMGSRATEGTLSGGQYLISVRSGAQQCDHLKLGEDLDQALKRIRRCLNHPGVPLSTENGPEGGA